MPASRRRRSRKPARALGIFYVFKASFDKANRTSGQIVSRDRAWKRAWKSSAKVRAEFGVPVLTDVHTETQAAVAGEVVDILQIPAFLCRQTDLIEAAVATGQIVNLKKGQFLSPAEMGQVAEKARLRRARKKSCSPSAARRSATTISWPTCARFPIMKRFGCPVVFDATHSVQLPGGGGDKSAGQREFAPVLARAALAAGRERPVHRNASAAGPGVERRAEHDSAGGNAGAVEEPAESF